MACLPVDTGSGRLTAKLSKPLPQGRGAIASSGPTGGAFVRPRCLLSGIMSTRTDY